MTTDPVEPGEPQEAQPARPAVGRGPLDPFERAARREEQEELRREITRAHLLSRMTGGGSDMGAALAALGVPYLVWGLIRAAYYDFGSPTLPRSIVEFFFDDFWWFGAYTVLMLLVIWAAAITRFSDDD